VLAPLCTGIEKISVALSESVDEGPSALLEWMRVPWTLMFDPLYFWEDSRADDGVSTWWKNGFPLPRISYMGGLLDFGLTMQDMIFCSSDGASIVGSLGLQGRMLKLRYKEQIYMIKVVQRQHGGFFWKAVGGLGTIGVDRLSIGVGGRASNHFEEPIHMEQWISFLGS